MRKSLIAFFFMINALSASATDWEYSSANACYGAGTAKEEGLCANFTGAAHAICWGFKNALRNSCADMDPGDAQLACLGFKESHKKGTCSKIPGIGKDVCLAYTSSTADSSVCSYGTARQKAICYGFVYAWTEQSCDT
jgi:hypothetical protein